MRTFHFVLQVFAGCLLLVVAAVAEESPRILFLDGNDNTLTIGQLKPAFIDFSYRTAPRVAVGEIAQRYVRLLHSTRDPDIRLKALQRLASLESLFGKVVEDAISKEDIAVISVETYEDHLQKYREGSDTDWILYDLARAYEGAGQPAEARRVLERLVKRYPRSDLAAESWFRIGEIAYSQADYDAAETAFRKTLADPSRKPFEANAEYMLGWMLFKQDRLGEATDQFVAVLGKLQKQAEKQVRTELRDDVLRILSVIAEYQSGSETLYAALKRNKAEALAPLVYRSHYQFYLSRERYQDAAAVVDDFIASYPASPERVSFHQYRIDAFEQGGLPTLAWAEKERVVGEVAPGSVYWNKQTEEGRKGAREFLYQNLDQLGRKHYALAAVSKQPSTEWQAAAGYFQRYIELFPADHKSPEMYLLLGESRLKLGEWQTAIAAFNEAGYSFPDYAERPDAAYAGISAYPSTVEWNSQPDLRQQRVTAFEKFAETFREDARAATVMLAAANERFAMGDHEAAIADANVITAAPERSIGKPPTSEQITEAWIVKGHALFAMNAFADAEQAYASALQSLPSGDMRQAPLVENLAASIYRQGEALQASGSLLEAKNEYLRVLLVAPESSVAGPAQYDAAMRAIDLADWVLATELMLAYRQSYPLEAAKANIGQKLVFSYRQTADYKAAAGELLALEASLDPEAAREARFEAASLYLESGDTGKAGSLYADYVNKYPAPLEPAIQAYASLIDVAEANDDSQAAANWRARLIALENGGGDQRTAGTRTLAAKAGLELAEMKKVAYESQRLTLPLAKSLARKSEYLRELVGELNQVNSYGIQEYVTASTHMMGIAYQQLSQDILQSERPSPLSDLESEQYDLLLEEQAFPFEEKAIDIFEANIRRVPQGTYDGWIEKSYQQLSQLMPSRYARSEVLTGIVGELK